MCEIGKTRLYVVDVPKQPIKNVDEVAKLSEQCPSVHVQGPFPRNLAIVSIVTVPKTIHLDHMNPPQDAGLYHFLKPDTRRTVAILHHAKHLLPHCQCSRQNRLSFTAIERHRLLHYDVVLAFQSQK